jgi:hypothetical protein
MDLKDKLKAALHQEDIVAAEHFLYELSLIHFDLSAKFSDLQLVQLKKAAQNTLKQHNHNNIDLLLQAMKIYINLISSFPSIDL